MKNLYIELDEKLHNEYKAVCAFQGTTMKETTEQLINEFLTGVKNENPYVFG